MCGIAGAVGFERDAALPAVVRACRSMWARGPDDGGIEEKGAAVLGARRLAIIDPSLAGHQPMRDPGRGLTLVFNGMIYNFRDLRRRLEAEGERFSSRSDTEVLLRAYGRWGASCIGRLEGMFAFAIWDDVGGELVLARDPMGIKPLYYRHDGRRLIFASTVRALLATGLVPRTLSREGDR